LTWGQGHAKQAGEKNFGQKFAAPQDCPIFAHIRLAHC
jgi:hypothetical protein